MHMFAKFAAGWTACGTIDAETQGLKSGGTMKPSDATTTQEARLDFRLTRDVKRTIEQAAAVRGQSLTDFALSTLYERAKRVLEEESLRSAHKPGSRHLPADAGRHYSQTEPGAAPGSRSIQEDGQCTAT